MSSFKPKFVRKVRKVIRKPMAKKAMSMVRALKREVEGDKKFHDIQYTETNQSTTAVVTQISDVSQVASGFNNQTATSSYYYLGKSIQIRATIYPTVNVPSQEFYPSNLRVIMFQDKEVATTYAAPTAADLLQFPTDINSPLNLKNCKRFKILSDKQFGVGESPSQAHFKIFVKIPKRTARIGFWTDGTNNTPRENQIYLLTYSDSTSDEPSISWISRFRFIDT